MLQFRQKHPVVITTATLLFLLVATGYIHHRLPKSRIGFQHYTGVTLPPNVRVVAHDTEMTENLFHTTHLWTLFGGESDFVELAKAFCLERSDEDARWTFSGVQEKFDPHRTKGHIIAGYEGNCTKGRDRWLIIYGDGNNAAFIF
jgi:hypothetical protein